MTGQLFSADAAKPWLAALDPRLKLAWVFTVSVAAATLNDVRALGILTFFAVVAATGLRLTARGWSAIVLMIGLLVWGTMLSQGLFYYGKTVLVTFVEPRQFGDYSFPGIRLTTEGLIYGAIQSLRFVATALAGFTASLSTGPERMLSALVCIKLPASLAYMTTAALRFLPVVLNEVAAVRRARRLRGGRFAWIGPTGDRFGPYRDEVQLLLPILAAALRRAETLAESVTARGFDPRAPRTFYPPLVMREFEKLIIVLLLGICVLLIFAQFLPTAV
jgi:energy-coupling factor transporter transmembrane protein EcfT